MRQPAILILLCTLLLASSGTEPNFVVAPRPGKDYALFIAVNNYQNSKLIDFANPQGNPKKDAQEIEQLLKDQYGFSTERLIDPTAAVITAKLEQYERDFRSGTKDPNGQLFLFFSGHGEREYGNGFFLAADADPTKLYEKSIPYALWRPRIANFNCKHIMVVIDACYSGTFDPNWFNRPKSYGTRTGELDATAKLQANYDDKKTRMFFTSATEVQSPEISSFAKKLKEGLLSNGGVDGILTSTELFSSLELSSPRPHRGEFEQDEAGSTYLFFSQTKNNPSPDTDLDGIPDTRDECPGLYAKTPSGCPDADEDGIPDPKDKCPYESGPASNQGCPTQATDSDGDGIPDAGDACPTEKGLARFAGCPDTDSDGIPDKDDNCPRQSGSVSNKGCPTATLDRDRDGVPDSIDNCPDQVGPPSNNGCPMATDYSYDDPYIGRMIFIKGGTFQMGDANGRDDAKPVHTVVLSDFYLGETEVTQAQWRAVMGIDPAALSFKGCDQCPVEGVSWNDVQEFIKKINTKTAKNYRLPTEAEWEYAAKGGKNQAYAYAGGDREIDVAWYNTNSLDKTRPVRQKEANDLRIHDMSGNVYEWCFDWYDLSYYSKNLKPNPPGPITGTNRVIRGGAWSSYPDYLRVSTRYFASPDRRSDFIGFRLARN